MLCQNKLQYENDEKVNNNLLPYIRLYPESLFLKPTIPKKIETNPSKPLLKIKESNQQITKNNLDNKNQSNVTKTNVQIDSKFKLIIKKKIWIKKNPNKIINNRGIELTDQKEIQEYQSRKYKCEYCYKRFKRSSGYKDHLNLHLNKKDFKCSLCNKSFVQRSNLKQHLNYSKSCGTKPYERYSCNICSKNFSTLTILNKHINMLHNNNATNTNAIDTNIITNPNSIISSKT